MTPKEALVRQSAQGDLKAWQELQTLLGPEILATGRRNHRMRRKGLDKHPDHLHEIQVASLERLSHDSFANLKEFLRRERASSTCAVDGFDSRFSAWVYGAVDFVIRAHITKVFGPAPKLSRDEAQRPQPSKRDLHTLAGCLEDQPERAFISTLGMTARLTVGELFSRIERVFTAEEALAMKLYYKEERSFDEVARELGLSDAKAADQMIRKLNARLRYHVGKESA